MQMLRLDRLIPILESKLVAWKAIHWLSRIRLYRLWRSSQTKLFVSHLQKPPLHRQQRRTAAASSAAATS